VGAVEVAADEDARAGARRAAGLFASCKAIPAKVTTLSAATTGSARMMTLPFMAY
jgi:hypothetical protein